MKYFIRKFERWVRKSKGLSKLQDFQQQQEKFKKKYPKYPIGLGSYGLPDVQCENEGGILRIGAFSSIASNVQIFLGGQHRSDWVSSYPFPAFFEQAAHIPQYGGSRGDVVIGSDVWLCANCIILSGVTIGHGAVIANGAVVTRSVEPYSVMAGNPAKLVKWRFDENTRAALLKSEWWLWPETEIRNVMQLLCSENIDDFLQYAKNRVT